MAAVEALLAHGQVFAFIRRSAAFRKPLYFRMPDEVLLAPPRALDPWLKTFIVIQRDVCPELAVIADLRKIILAAKPGFCCITHQAQHPLMLHVDGILNE